MPEMGIPYILTGPDGTRAVFNSPSDPDFVGYLDVENGITGLLDGATIRESFTDHVEADGVAMGNNYFSRRVGTLQGIIWPDPDMPSVMTRESKIKRASRGKLASAPAVLTWTPTSGVTRQLRVWRQAEVRVTGRRPKQFLLPLSTQDPYHYSDALHSQVILPGVGGEAGFASPITSPLTSVFSVGGQGFVVNSGDAETWPIFTILGPITNPTLLNNTSGLQWTLTYTLGAGETMVVDSKLRTVLFNGVTNRYSAYAANFSINTWWPLLPSNNDIRLLSFSNSVPSQVTVQWRDAFE